jgi:16S rRNA (uracil1498-N3)-methyltransferase
MKSKHEFAVYAAQVSVRDKKIELQDQDSLHRIRSVLRLAVDDELIVFDDQHYYKCRITGINKKTVLLSLLSMEQSVPLEPSIIVLLPLLKREAFERMLYACLELGANLVQPIITEKSQRSWRNDHDLKRARAIMIAAAEQSKQFLIPEMHAPVTLEEAVVRYADHIKLVADPAGNSLYEVLTHVRYQAQAGKKESIVMTFGPEGDFTDTEKEFLKNASYQSVRLTPTVLRAQQAGALLLGVVRSIISQ